MRNKNTGITLIALVITIIVLLILAAVSIATLTGENGILTKAQDASERTREATAREQIEVEAVASFDGNGKFNKETFKERIEGIGGKVVEETEDEIIVELDDYEVTVDAKTGEILNIESSKGVRPEIEVNLYTESGAKLVEGVSYENLILTVNITNYDKLGKVDEITVVDESGAEQTPESDIIGTGYRSFKVKATGKYTITVKATTENVQKSASITTSVKVAPAEWELTTKNDPDWYNYGEADVNPPKLVGEMTPIKYKGDIGTENTNKWANAITADGSMWVWIPRYAYKIKENYHNNTAGEIDIKFIKGTGSTPFESTSEKILTDPSEVTYEENNKQNEFLVHPAFTGVPANGGWKTDVTGIWVAKFEPSGTTSEIHIKAGVSSLRSMKINEQYKLAKNSTYGESITAEELGSHMAKNSEWGAVAYLTQSKYGTKGVAIEKNTNSNFTTGGSTTKSTIYSTESNAKQSTTLNAYGIYDMNGCGYEYVASYVNNGENNLATYGGEEKGDLFGAEEDDERATSTPYKTVYEGTGTQSTDYAKTEKFKGDAIWETSNSHSDSTGSWHGAYADFPYSSYPFFSRGGSYDSPRAGLFYFSYSNGAAYTDSSFRPVLIP